MSKLIVTVLAGFVLASCDGFQAEAIGKARGGADAAARGLVAAPCAMTTGAYFRLNEQKRLAVSILCGGDFMARIRGLIAQ